MPLKSKGFSKGGGFIWIIPPQTKLIPNILGYHERVLVAIIALLEKAGKQMQTQGRQNAGWNDITGNARAGIFYAVEGFENPPIMGQVQIPDAAYWAEHYRDLVKVEPKGKDWAVMVFSHSMAYGRILELRGGSYAVILSEFMAGLQTLENDMRNVFK